VVTVFASSGLLADIFFGVLSGIASDIVSGIASGVISDVISDLLSVIGSAILADASLDISFFIAPSFASKVSVGAAFLSSEAGVSVESAGGVEAQAIKPNKKRTTIDQRNTDGNSGCFEAFWLIWLTADSP